MKSITIALIILLTAVSFSFGQTNDNTWAQLNFLIGNWSGEGGGEPGKGGGYFSFKLDLGNKIIVRNSHTEYPSADGKSTFVHEDLMIVYPDYSGAPGKAIYFDNEGHVINYSITFPNNNNVVFTSDTIPNVPVFRLTYSKLDDNLVNVKFDISQDGENFKTYVEGKSKKII